MFQLPQHIDGSTLTLDGDSRTLVIVGANGAGKSRFTESVIHQLGDKAVSLSALRAIYGTPNSVGEPSYIDRIYAERTAGDLTTSRHTSELDHLSALLLHDEMANLLRYKIEIANKPKATLRRTNLDQLVAIWQEIFPDNKILIESGKMLFNHPKGAEAYSPLKLSHGERTVLYYIGASLYLPKGAAVFIDSPEMFLHPSVVQALWNRIEQLRPDCRFIYTTHDLDFASTRTPATIIWVRNFNPDRRAWDYQILPDGYQISGDVYASIVGSRKPVLFIEGDGVRSIDSKIYPLIFKDHTVQSLGSCNKVIEATRTFNDLSSLHHMDSIGIVDRDRRTEKEVDYLRERRVMVPNVAEVENILMLEDVIRAVAHSRRKDEHRVFAKVKSTVMAQFSHDLRQQALQHTRHQVKRTVEYRIDGRFANINNFEQHISTLFDEINPRGLYESICREFRSYLEADDYQSVLRVYNQKSILPGSNVAALCGLSTKDEYINAIIDILHTDSNDANRIRQAVLRCFNIDNATE